MRVLLINPFYPLAEMPSPPLGIAYLGAALERGGVEVRVFDMCVSGYSAEKLEAIIADFDPQMVGATAVTMTFNSAIDAIEDAKRIAPHVVTAMGGAHVSFCASQTLRSHPGLDVVAMGEGEEMVLELCDAIEGKRSYASVQGLAFRDGDDVVEIPARPSFLDVDTLPLPARHLTPLARYRALGVPISMTSSRGCPFQCIFCVGRKMVGAKFRKRDAANVVDEMEHIVSLGFDQINLADDLFTANKPHAYGVCDEILARGLSLTWTSFANVNTVDVPLLTRMKQAGCVTVSFGLESANPEILKTVKKGTKVHRIVSAVEACNEAGMRAHGSFIVGLPGETPETLRETLDFSEQLHAMGAETGFHLLAPFPGTAVRDDAAGLKLRILTDDWTQYHANRAITETPGVDTNTSQDVVTQLEDVAKRRFWELAEHIEDGTASEQDYVSYEGVVRQAVYYDLMMQDVLECHGSFRTDGGSLDAQEALGGLTDRVQAATGRDRSEIARALAYGLEHDMLEYTVEGGVCTWRFCDTPESMAVTEIVRRPPDDAPAVATDSPAQ